MTLPIEPPSQPLSQIEILEFIKELEKVLRHSLISFWEYEPSLIHVTIARWNERGGYQELHQLSFKH